MRRSQRIAALTKQLTSRPNHVFSVAEFSEAFQAAKSTLSEDLTIMREAFAQQGLGRVETIPGASGGVKYVPTLSGEQILEKVGAICQQLAQPQRILPGGFIYVNDLVASPAALSEIGDIFAFLFQEKSPQYVVTVETGGIPIALMAARSLNIPLVVVRRTSRLTEGPVLTMNYLSGSSKRVETMSLSRRALPSRSRVLLIDDFMKAGGTLKGLADLMSEFDCDVVGMGVLIETAHPQDKLISQYSSLICLQEVDEMSQRVTVKPAEWIKS